MTIENKAKWDEIVASPEGRIFVDVAEGDYRFVILRGTASLCAYLGIPLRHPLAWRPYLSLHLHCHGGLTFGHPGTGKHLSAGYYWYGWDYCHAGDKICFDANTEAMLASIRKETRKKFPFSTLAFQERAWDVEMVEADSVFALEQFKHLIDEAEKTDRLLRKVYRHLLSTGAGLWLYWRAVAIKSRYERWRMVRLSRRLEAPRRQHETSDRRVEGS